MAGFLLSTALLNVKPSPVFADVLIGGRGPYRFLVDTGAQTSLLDPKLAAELGLAAEFRTEVVTQNSASPYPAANVLTLRIGNTPLPPTEMVFMDFDETRRLGSPVRGLLGLNALTGLDFALTPGTGLLQLAPARPRGEVVPFLRMEDRIAVKAQMGEETLTLILDSGSTHMVLFRTPQAMKKTPPVTTTLATLEGARSVVPTLWTMPLSFGKAVRISTLPAAIVNRPGTAVDGLLPASAFRQVFVDQGREELVLVQ